jgi:hypothetical protein
MKASNPSLLMFSEGNIVKMRVTNEQVALKFHSAQLTPCRSRTRVKPLCRSEAGPICPVNTLGDRRLFSTG